MTNLSTSSLPPPSTAFPQHFQQVDERSTKLSHIPSPHTADSLPRQISGVSEISSTSSPHSPSDVRTQSANWPSPVHSAQNAPSTVAPAANSPGQIDTSNYPRITYQIDDALIQMGSHQPIYGYDVVQSQMDAQPFVKLENQQGSAPVLPTEQLINADLLAVTHSKRLRSAPDNANAELHPDVPVSTKQPQVRSTELHSPPSQLQPTPRVQIQCLTPLQATKFQFTEFDGDFDDEVDGETAVSRQLLLHPRFKRHRRSPAAPKMTAERAELYEEFLSLLPQKEQQLVRISAEEITTADAFHRRRTIQNRLIKQVSRHLKKQEIMQKNEKKLSSASDSTNGTVLSRRHAPRMASTDEDLGAFTQGNAAVVQTDDKSISDRESRALKRQANRILDTTDHTAKGVQGYNKSSKTIQLCTDTVQQSCSPSVPCVKRLDMNPNLKVNSWQSSFPNPNPPFQLTPHLQSSHRVSNDPRVHPQLPSNDLINNNRFEQTSAALQLKTSTPVNRTLPACLTSPGGSFSSFSQPYSSMSTYPTGQYDISKNSLLLLLQANSVTNSTPAALQPVAFQPPQQQQRVNQLSALLKPSSQQGPMLFPFLGTQQHQQHPQHMQQSQRSAFLPHPDPKQLHITPPTISTFLSSPSPTHSSQL